MRKIYPPTYKLVLEFNEKHEKKLSTQVSKTFALVGQWIEITFLYFLPSSYPPNSPFQMKTKLLTSVNKKWSYEFRSVG